MARKIKPNRKEAKPSEILRSSAGPEPPSGEGHESILATSAPTRARIGSALRRSIGGAWQWVWHRRHWGKFLLCLNLMIFAVSIAWQWWALATPPDVASGWAPALQEVEVYVSDPQAVVRLTVDLRMVEDKTSESMCLAVEPEGLFVQWMVMATGVAYPWGEPVPTYSGYSLENPPYDREVVEGTWPPIEPPGPSVLCPEGGAFFGSAELDAVAQLSEGLFTAHLPRVGSPFGGRGEPMIELIRETTRTSRIIISAPQPEIQHSTPEQYPPDLDAYPSVLVGANREAFYLPGELIATERLSGIEVRELSGYRFDSVVPPSYSIEGGSIVWRGVSGLEPSMTATSIAWDQFRSRYTLLTGIAIGVAASAGIACIQEWPSRARRKASRPPPTLKYRR